MKSPAELASAGAVMLGREYRLTLPKAHNHNLRELAKFHNLSPTELATKLLIFQLDREAFRVASAFATVEFLMRFPYAC